MIEAYIVEVVVIVEVWDMVPNNESFKIKWRSKDSEAEDEEIGKDSYLDVKTIRTYMLQLSKIWTLYFGLLVQN